MIAGIIGKLGRGKTVLLTTIAYLNHKFGSFYVNRLLYPELFDLTNSNKIYANYKLNFPFEPVNSYSGLEKMEKGSAFLDEFWLWADSRMSLSSKNKIISMMALTSRKRGLNVYYTAQNFSRIEKRIRNITDILILPNYDIRTGILKVEVIEPAENYKKVIKAFSLNVKPFFELYDTRQEITDIYEDDIKEVSKRKIKNNTAKRDIEE